MRVDDFWIENDPVRGSAGGLDLDLLERLRAGPIAEDTDLEAAIALARVLDQQFRRYGTDSTHEIGNEESREAMRTLRALTDRIGAPFDPPYRDLTGFRAYWGSHGGYGSWAARRALVQELFDPLHKELERREDDALRGELSEPVSPHGATGWPAVDEEIAELRRHFHAARTVQDYRNIGNDVVAVLEAISEVAYVPARHLFAGETEPPVSLTKNRLTRIVEVDAGAGGSAEIVKLAKATIELAQAVKHNAAGSRTRAGIAADAVIQLANILRRLQSAAE
jgi:hypothetical protein